MKRFKYPVRLKLNVVRPLAGTVQRISNTNIVEMNNKKKALITLIVFVTLLSCVPDKRKDIELPDLILLLKTETKIDSVFVSNIAQDELFRFLPYSDTLYIKSENTFNDLYNINFFSG
jgi:hypothetical protein